MKNRWAILCSNAVVDKDSNSISLFNVIEEIQMEVVGSKPPSKNNPLLAPIQVTLVLLDERSDLKKAESGTGRVRMIDPNGKELGTNLFKVDLKDHRRFRTMVRFQAVALTVDGLYRFIIEHQDDAGQWNEVNSVPLEVVISLKPPDKSKNKSH